MSEAIYTSRYTDKKVTAAQLLAEKMVERKYGLRNTKLPQKFWDDLRYRKDFLNQLRFANSLLRLYSFEAINTAITSKEAQRTFSLTAKWLDPIIMREQSRLDLLKKQREDGVAAKQERQHNQGQPPVGEAFRKEFTKPTLKDLL